MKRLFLACALLALSPLSGWGQEPAIAAPGGTGLTRTPIIAVIDIQRVTAESVMGQELATQLQAVQQAVATQTTAKQSELNVQRQEVDSLQMALNRDVATLSADEAESRLAVIRAKERDIQAFFEDGQRELERLEQQAQQRAAELQTEYQQMVSPLIEEVSNALGVDILLDGQAAIFVAADFDISDALIERMNQATNESGN